MLKDLKLKELKDLKLKGLKGLKLLNNFTSKG